MIHLYATLHSNFLYQQPPPTLTRAYQTFLQEESVHAMAQTQTVPDDFHVFAVKGSFECPDKYKLHCTHCKKHGHDVSTCFKLHGRPT